MIFSYFATHILGKGDSYSLIWRLWHTQKALFEGRWQNLFSTHLQFYPLGTSLHIDTPILNSLISFPIYLLGGPVLAYNFLIFFSFTTTYIGMYLFLRSITQNKYAGVIGALGFTFSMWRVAHIRVGHIDLISTQWIGFGLWCMYMYKENKKISHLIGTAFFLLLQIYTDYKLGVMFFLVSSSLFVYWILFALICRKTKSVQFFAFFFIITLVIFCIGLIPLYNIQKSHLIPMYSIENTIFQIRADSVTLRSLFIPGYESKSAYLGIVSIIITVVYILFIKKSIWEFVQLLFWGVMFIVFLLFSFGPRIPFFYSLTQSIPFAWVFHVSDHFIMIVQIALSVIVGLSFSRIFIYIKNDIKRRIFFLFFCMVIILQNPGFIRFPIITIDIYNPIVKYIKKNQDGSVLSIPFGYFDSYRLLSSYEDQRIFLDQIFFHKPIMAGYVTRVDDELYHAYRREMLFNSLIRCQQEQKCRLLSKKEIKRIKEYYRVKYIIIYDALDYKEIFHIFNKAFPNAKIMKYQNMTLLSL